MHEKPGRRGAFGSGAPPDTGVLYSIEDIAERAGTTRVAVSRLCRQGRMPPPHLLGGKRYWDRSQLFEAVRIARQEGDRRSAA